MHEQLIDRYGGSHGIRDEGLLDSAISTPYEGFGDFKDPSESFCFADSSFVSR